MDGDSETGGKQRQMTKLISLISIAISAALYVSFYHLNAWLFKAFELHSGANWVFLPAGLRLMCTLVFGIDGAIGLMVAELLLMHQNPGIDPVTGIVNGLISAGAPFLIYRAALRGGMPASLEKLSASRLSALALVYALANSSLFSFWFTVRGGFPYFVQNWITMFIGDLLGTLIMIYALKIALALFRRDAHQPL